MHQTLRWLVVAAPLAFLAVGCVYVFPVPTAYHPVGSRRNLTEATATRFAPGTTTVDEVVLALGEPDEAAGDGSWLNYRWERVNMHLLRGWAIPAGEVAVGQGWETIYSHEYSLGFAFDQRGVLQYAGTTNVAVRNTDTTHSP
jgi:hypothetical protein